MPGRKYGIQISLPAEILPQGQVGKADAGFWVSRAAIVTTREEYEETLFQWTTFAYQDEAGARMDVILFRMEAKEGFGHAKSAVYLQELGEASIRRKPAEAKTPLMLFLWAIPEFPRLLLFILLYILMEKRVKQV